MPADDAGGARIGAVVLGRAVVVVPGRGVLHGAALQPPVGLASGVRRDHVDPGAEPAPAREGADLCGDRQQRILAGVLGVGAMRQHALADPHHLRLHLPDQLVQQGGVLGSAPGKFVERVRVVDHGVEHNDGMVQPSHFGRYAVIRRLGSGGFAAVWLARDEELDAEVAVKVLAEHWVDDLDVRRRFVEEGRFLRKVESPYVVGVHDIGTTEDDRPFLVLTYADRGTLADRIKAGPLPLTDAVAVIDNVSAGLQQLHDRGVLHRDVKPENVLFRSTPTGERAMLGDLGLGKSLEAVSRVTMPGGTPAYVAPEQVRGDVLDPRADLYALAAVTYAALALPTAVRCDHAGGGPGCRRTMRPPCARSATTYPSRWTRSFCARCNRIESSAGPTSGRSPKHCGRQHWRASLRPPVDRRSSLGWRRRSQSRCSVVPHGLPGLAVRRRPPVGAGHGREASPVGRASSRLDG